MKLKKIAQLCNKEKTYILYDHANSSGWITQWLGDGCAAYPLAGVPLLDEDSLCRLFDISDKRRDKLIIQRLEKPSAICMEDTDPAEVQVQALEPNICDRGRELIPLKARDGIIFIQKKYLSPFDREENMIELYQRKTGGESYIAVKTGLLVRALIFPVRTVNDKFIEQLSFLLRECQRTAENQAEPSGWEGAYQITWTEEAPGEDQP